MKPYCLCLFSILLFLPLCAAAQTRAQKPLIIPVDDVKPASEPYNTFDSRRILEQQASKTMIVTSKLPGQLVPAAANSFIETVHLAYSQHHNLVLSPDDIWIQIALGVSIHVNQNFEQLNGKVLHSPEKKELFIRLDSLNTLKTGYWRQLIDTFTVLARRHVKPEFYETMLPEFSTSTPETRAVLNAILLSSVKESLSLRAASGCGIPNVVLLGTKADWEKILAHLDRLEQYDLRFWTDELKPVIREFVAAFEGNADREFWQRIYKYREGYMMMQMNGWISKFFPYFTEGEYVDDPDAVAAYVSENPGIVIDDAVIKTTYYRNPYLKGDDYQLHAIDLWSLPSSVCTVPLVWNNLLSPDAGDHEQHLTLYAGMMGTVQQGPKFDLRNNPVWFIVRSDEYFESDYDNWMGSGKRVESYIPYFWSDDIVTDSVNVIYHPERNKTTEAGIAELKQELRECLERSFPAEDLSGTRLTFIVSHFGSCTNIRVESNRLSEKAQAELELQTRKLNHRFQPAMIDFDKSQDDIRHADIEGHPPKVPANAQITLAFDPQ
jgi:hypothetical protein